MGTPAADLAILRRCIARLRYLAVHNVGRRQQHLMESTMALAQKADDADERLAAALPDEYDGCTVAGASEEVR